MYPGNQTVSERGFGMLEVRGLRKSYGHTVALAGVDLDVAVGEIVGLLGPNGAGKTTLVSIVAGLRHPDAGTVRIGGIDALAHPRAGRHLLGVAPQDTGVYPTLTCRDNLRFFAELTGLRRKALQAAIDSVAAALGLSQLLDRRAQSLSGGERRRLHTAISLVHRPRLVLLDEPTTGADVRTRTQLLQLVADLAAGGSAVLYSTHYLTEIEQLDASVVLIDHGRSIARGSVGELIAAHATSIVELTFAGPAPQLANHALPAAIETDGAVLRARTHDPGPLAARILNQLGAAAGDLRSLRIVQPSLETVFLELTGRGYHPDPNPETADVA
jgi:ABC-2 type transport system ATP-binding protein